MTTNRIGIEPERRKEIIRKQREDREGREWAIAERLYWTDHFKRYLCPKCWNRFWYLEFEEHIKSCKEGIK